LDYTHTHTTFIVNGGLFLKKGKDFPLFYHKKLKAKVDSMTRPINDTFLRAARGEETDYTPVWYMRQAGRSQPEYRKIKEKYSLVEITHQPELCAYVTELPVVQYNNDAAILYKDIMTPIPGIGCPMDIVSGIGPVMEKPLRTMAEIDAIRPLVPEEAIPFVGKTIDILVNEMLNVPLIGFAGGPFTLASYMIEGRPSKDYKHTKAMMHSEPAMWFKLMDKLGDMVITYVKYQIQHGAKAIQIFDSWVGALNKEDYIIYIKPVMERIFTALREENVPLIMFGVGASHLAKVWNDLPLDVVGLDWRLSIPEARAMGINKVVQGNLDPTLLISSWDVLEKKAKEIVEQGIAHPGHLFNLGHGVFPTVEPDTLRRLTALVHEYSTQLKSSK
jgi:uroporphyrinogen decarboxylase